MNSETLVVDPATSATHNYRLLIGCIVPRPIAFVSTISPNGAYNLVNTPGV